MIVGRAVHGVLILRYLSSTTDRIMIWLKYWSTWTHLTSLVVHN